MDEVQQEVLEEIKAAISGKIAMHTNEGTQYILTNPLLPPLFVRFRRSIQRPNAETLSALKLIRFDRYQVTYAVYGESETPGVRIRLAI